MVVVLHSVMDPVMDPVLSVKEPKEVVATRALNIEDPKATLLEILERAADDPVFIAQLTDQGSKALRSYDLTSEEQAALLSGDINWIEAHFGKLDARLSTWLRCRLQQEIW